MTESDYEKRADELRLSNSDGFITYNIFVNKKDGSTNQSPRAVKYREIDLPATKHDNKFYEMVIYSLVDDKVVAYYLCTPIRLEKEKQSAIFDLDGNNYGNNNELRNKLFQDKRSLQTVSNFVQKRFHEKEDDDVVDESYSVIKPLRNKQSSVIGYLKIDPKTGDQMITDRFGKLKGWYRKRTDITFDNSGRLVGFGNVLTTLLN